MIALAGATAYAIMLGVFMLLGYLVLVLSARGVGAAQKASQSFNYICSAGVTYGVISSSPVFGFSMFGRLVRGFAFGIPLGLMGAVISACLSAPLFTPG